MMAAVGMLAALLERERTGRGRFVDVSMLDGIDSWLSIHLGNHLADPDMLTTARPLSGDLACYRVYRCADGRFVTVGALEPHFWRALCQTLGYPELVEEQYSAPTRQAEMAALMQARFETKSRDEWVEAFADAGACVGPVNDLGEAANDPQVRHRGMIAEAQGRAVGPAPALRLVDREGELRAAPGLGEHTDEVLAEAGLSSNEVRDLRSQGVV